MHCWCTVDNLTLELLVEIEMETCKEGSHDTRAEKRKQQPSSIDTHFNAALSRLKLVVFYSVLEKSLQFLLFQVFVCENLVFAILKNFASYFNMELNRNGKNL